MCTQNQAILIMHEVYSACDPIFNRRAVAEVTSDLSLKHDITISVAVKALAQFEQYKMIYRIIRMF